MEFHVNENGTTVAVYFDIDGTLLERRNDQDEIVATANRFAVDVTDEQIHQFDELVQQYFQRNVADGYREAVKRFTSHLGIAVDIDAFTAVLKDLKVENTRLRDGTEETIAEFAEETAVGIITNGDGDVQREKLSSHGIADHFDHVIISGERNTMKPKDGMFALAKREREADRYVYVADRLGDDIVPARENGFATVWVADASSPIPDLTVSTLDDLTVGAVLDVVQQ